MKKLLLLSVTLLALTVACGESEQDIKIAELENKITELDEIVAKLDRRATELEIDLICEGENKRLFAYYDSGIQTRTGNSIKRAICTYRDEYLLDRVLLKKYEYVLNPEQFSNYISIFENEPSWDKAKYVMRGLIEDDYESLFVKK
jgi:hypothetical protein